VDKNGQVWAGTNHGAFQYNGFTFSNFEIPFPNIEKLSFKWEAGKVWDIREDKQGNIWFARDGYGACKYDGKIFSHFTKKDGLCSNNVSRTVEDKEGNIWFATLKSDLPEAVKEGGVCCYDGSQIRKFPEFEGLSQNDIYSLYCDRKGNVWIGATGLGVYRYDGKSFKLFKGTDRMDLTYSVGIQSIMEDQKGAIWFGFSGGLFRFDGTSIKNVTQGGPWE
jgi:ligand-binding sensor domain-containing protein